MLKKTLFLFAVLPFFVSAAYATDMDNYVSLKLGMAVIGSDLVFNLPGLDITQRDSADRFMGSIAVGHEYKNIRGELEYIYRGGFETKNPFVVPNDNTVKQSMQSYMIQTYYDFPVNSPVIPFFNFGIGWTDVSCEYKNSYVNSIFGANQTIFTYSFGLGLTYNFAEKINFDLGYRYIKLDKSLKQGTAVPVAIEVTDFSHDIYLGARYKF
jgi:opacity protein-like surface antigen